MTKPLAKLIPLLARGVMPTAAVVSGLLSPVCQGAPGDLDPSFADHGRLGPLFGFSGPIWSLEPLANDEMFFGGGNFDEGCFGGGWYCYYEFDASGFFGKLSTQGVVDPAYDAAGLENTEVRDVVLQPDGKAIAVGRTVTESNLHSVMAVFRLNANGSLDHSFGIAGMALLPTGTDELGSGSSVSLDPDGRIVVAGYRNGELAVVRLLPNGSLDSTFGAGGVFVGPGVDSAEARTQILRTAFGTYRVATNLSDPRASAPSPCQIVGLTVNGALDTSFGTSGIVDLSSVLGPTAFCSSAISQSDGRLLVAGAAESQAFVTRLQASGVADPSFATDSVGDTMNAATALALGQNGSVLVAGRGPDGVTGALVARLQADGELDVLFGNSGSTQIDLDRDWLSTPIVHEMAVLPNGRVMVAGADHAFGPARPFVVRLVGEGGAGPGVVSAAQPLMTAKEENQQAVVTVRRTGGSAGNISVAYRTLTSLIPDATPGVDFTSVSGRLEWADGDASDRRILVPLIADTATATPEWLEYFRVELSDLQGAAGFGTRGTEVQILADGAPGGQFAIEAYSSDESSGVLRAYVFRNYYSEGAVSVTVTPIAGTATAGEDFVATPVTLSWSDGDSNVQWIDIAITDDSTAEPFETFNLQLSNPTGGAIIGPRSVTTATILASDQIVPPRPPSPPSPPVNQPPRYGAGSLGYFSVLFLGVAGFLRAVRRKVLGAPSRADQERVSSVSS